MVFMKKDRNEAIRGTPDTVPGVIYWTGPKEMDQFKNYSTVAHGSARY